MRLFQVVTICVCFSVTQALLTKSGHSRQPFHDKRGLASGPILTRDALTRRSIANKGPLSRNLGLHRRGPVEEGQLFRSLSSSSYSSTSSFKSAESRSNLREAHEQTEGSTAGDHARHQHQQQHARGGQERRERTWQEWRREITPEVRNALHRVGLGILSITIGQLLNRPRDQAALMRLQEQRHAAMREADVVRARLARMEAMEPAQWAHVHRVAALIAQRTGLDVREVTLQIVAPDDGPVHWPGTFGGRPTPHGEQQRPLTTEEVLAYQRTMNDFVQHRQRQQEFTKNVKKDG